MQREALVQKLEKVLQFAFLHVSRIHEHCVLPGADAQEYSEEQIRDKVIGETALLLLIASRVPDKWTEVHRLLADLAGALSAAARTLQHKAMLLRFPATSASLGLAHVALTKCGYPDAVFDAILRAAMNTGQLTAVERPPFRHMDTRWVAAVARETQPDCGDLIHHSILHGDPHPIYMSRTDAYAVTHAIMYLTDFGTSRLPADVDRAKVATIVDSCLAWHLTTGDNDLLGELLICSAALHHGSPYVALASHVLYDTWDSLGFVPSPCFSPAEYSKVERDQAVRYAFQTLYHTMYVAGLLCSLQLMLPGANSARYQPDVDASLPPLCKRISERAFVFCTQCNCNPDMFTMASEVPECKPADWIDRARPPGSTRWEHQMSVVPLTEADSLLVLSDAALIRAAREYNLALLATSLLQASSLSQSPSRTFIEATKFLVRQQLPCGAIGAACLLPDKVQGAEELNVTLNLGNQIEQIGKYLNACLEKQRKPNNPRDDLAFERENRQQPFRTLDKSAAAISDGVRKSGMQEEKFYVFGKR